MTVADRIREKRKELGLLQEELAERAGYRDKTSISKLENSGNDISMKQVKRCASALGCTTAYLMGWERDGVDVQEVEEEQPQGPYFFKDDIQKAMDLYEKYKRSTPEVRAAVELLLKPR
jgi:transcriptional regulator with XRE-family HTH domain